MSREVAKIICLYDGFKDLSSNPINWKIKCVIPSSTYQLISFTILSGTWIEIPPMRS